VPDPTRRCASTRVLSSGKTRRHCRNPRVAAFGSGYCVLPPDAPDVSACARRVRSGPLASLLPHRRRALLLRSVRGCRNHLQPLRPRAPYLFFGVMLELPFGTFAPVSTATRRVHRAWPLLLFAGHDREYGRYAKFGKWARWGVWNPSSPPSPWRTHSTLPEEVVLWNWRRTLLFSACHWALAAGNQSPLGDVGDRLICLPLMLWVAPVRPARRAVILDHCHRVGRGAVVCRYFFEPALFRARDAACALDHFEPAAFGVSVSYPQRPGKRSSPASPPLALALPVALIAHMAWRRSRYFGQHCAAADRGVAADSGAGALHFPGQGCS